MPESHVNNEQEMYIEHFSKATNKMTTTSEELTLGEVIDYFGYGSFSFKLTCIVGLLWSLDGIELTLITLIAPELKCKWNLTSFQTALTSTGIFIGLAVGSIFWGKFADKFGRRIFSLVGVAFMLYFGLLTTMATNFGWFLLMRFFVGLGLCSIILSPTYVSELISSKYQGRVMFALALFFTLGSFYAVFLAYLVMNRFGWRMFVFLATTPIGLTFGLLLWLPESVRYLETIGAVDAIMKILNSISVEHKMPIPKNIKMLKRIAERGNVSKLFTKKFRIKTLLLMVLWVCVMVMYFFVLFLNTQLEQMSGHATATNKSTCHTLTDSDYLQNMFIVLGEIPGLLVYAFIVDKFSRQNVFLSAFTVIITCLLILWMYGTLFYVRTFVMFILRGTTTSVLQLVWLYTAENCPTSLRATLLGLCCGTSRWSLIFIPFFVQYLIRVSFTATIFIFVGICILGGVVVVIRERCK